MSAASRKRGRPLGTTKVAPGRDLVVHYVVEWVVMVTGLPIGQGGKAGDEHNACSVASWLLSCPPTRVGHGEWYANWQAWQIEIWPAWMGERFTNIEHVCETFGYSAKRIRLSPRSVRDAYQRVQGSSGVSMRQSLDWAAGVLIDSPSAEKL